ncbi:MAG: SRPBCC family protein [Chloroflexi bacterium]|nr:SRPBCC family protein [Chloroflexota bacterium]
MAQVERQITIEAAAEKVFAYVADFPRHSEWAEVPLKLERTSEEPVGRGTVFKSVGRQLGRDFAADVTVTEYTPNQKLAYEAEGEAFHFRHHFLLQEEGGLTRLVKGTERVRIALPFSLLFPILSAFGVISRGLDGDLKRIKTRLEA